MNTPKWLTQIVLNASVPLLFRPLLAEDGVALEAEQIGYESHWNAPPIELNPIVPLLQKLTAQKWQGYVDRNVRSEQAAPVAEAEPEAAVV